MRYSWQWRPDVDTCEGERHIVHELAEGVQQKVVCHPAHETVRNTPVFNRITKS